MGQSSPWCQPQGFAGKKRSPERPQFPSLEGRTPCLGMREPACTAPGTLAQKTRGPAPGTGGGLAGAGTQAET